MSKQKNLIPVLAMIQNVINYCKEKKKEEYNRKIVFLHRHAEQYYYDSLEPINLSEVDLPYFMYENKRRKEAYDKASIALAKVIREKRVDACYKAKCKQLRAMARA